MHVFGDIFWRNFFSPSSVCFCPIEFGTNSEMSVLLFDNCVRNEKTKDIKCQKILGTNIQRLCIYLFKHHLHTFFPLQNPLSSNFETFEFILLILYININV
uniref:Uncharacterized protein n=1 Tax=Cacopsylla melanoneura TaxID=428564 RepID=A0A8D8TMQ0_9HEMI